MCTKSETVADARAASGERSNNRIKFGTAPDYFLSTQPQSTGYGSRMRFARAAHPRQPRIAVVIFAEAAAAAAVALGSIYAVIHVLTSHSFRGDAPAPPAAAAADVGPDVLALLHERTPFPPLHVDHPPVLPAPPTDSAYPPLVPLLGLLQRWNPDAPDLPPTFTETLQHFNYSDPRERAYAEAFRDAELPFKVYGVPDLDRVGARWTDTYLHDHLRRTRRVYVEKSASNHFMYWVPEGPVDPAWKPPIEVVDLPFLDWLRIAKAADRRPPGHRSGSSSSNGTHYYFMTSSKARGGKKQYFVAKDLPMFSTDTDNFFVTDVAATKGIQCRFSTKGITMAAHFDVGRNMIAVVKGAKRYVLAPPSACPHLGIISDVAHPSYRHSVVDWSDLSQAESRGFRRVGAVETVVRAGEVLYVPSYWFHYIVSARYSVQCNARSGVAARDAESAGRRHIERCLGPAFATYHARKYGRRPTT